jgi:nitrilase
MDNSTVKTTVIQAGPILFDTPRTLEKLADLTRDASAQGADLVVPRGVHRRTPCFLKR